MADAYKTLYQGQPTASVATLYTVPGSTAAIIKNVKAVNNDTVARTLTLYINGTAATNVWAKGHSIPPGGSIEWDGTVALEAAGTIRGLASVATMVTVTISGDEVT